VFPWPQGLLPPKIFALPGKDLTLLGYATDPENNPLTVLWILASGPAAVSFSAPTALTTTVTFTTAGTYTFQLTVSDGTSTVTDSVVVDGAEQIHPVPQWQGVARRGPVLGASVPPSVCGTSR
jgi:hypothetical protein